MHLANVNQATFRMLLAKFSTVVLMTEGLLKNLSSADHKE